MAAKKEKTEPTLQQQAKAGDAQAMFRLSLTLRDDTEAAAWLRKAANRGFAPAQNNLGVKYNKGQGVPQDNKEAVKWWRLSAEQGHASAQYNLGRSYEQGLGVLQDYVLAHMWVNLAASNGEEDAIEKRNMVEKEMTPQQIEKAKEMARNWKPKK